jgi:ABC-type dipeptide/oligopeptide/nickel transport system ATPase subunit
VRSFAWHFEYKNATEQIHRVQKKMIGSATDEGTIRVTTLGIAGGSGSGKVTQSIAVDVLHSLNFQTVS